MDNFVWWRDGVIYQIYPRSFADTNGDGIGDLNGIISHLDYLSELGIDAIWLSPIYPSPDRDFGYDISDYLSIDPKYGTLSDFDNLIVEVHKRGIHLIMDMVLNHTSDMHPWFIESRSNRENPKHDWYIWKDRVRGNKLPNNWQASFGGKAWEYDTGRDQFYLHSFTKEQPDLNWRNPDVRKALLDAFRFWMERGVDGFRLDVFNVYYKHPDLPDNPTRFGLRSFDRQIHMYDMDRPEMISLLQDLRKLLDSFPERYAVGETYMATLEKVTSYCGSDKLHSAFSFDFTNQNLIFPWNPSWFMEKIMAREKAFNPFGVWPTTVFSNHDLPRAASRYSRSENDSHAKLAMGLLLTLRGTPFIYYGEEIGMRNIHLPHSKIVDPAGKGYWPLYKGRDGCRSPMQWNSEPYAGFSLSGSWLPVHPNFKNRNVTKQKNEQGSLFHFTKSLLALRKEYPALQKGGFIPVTTPKGTLGYIRNHEKQSVLVLINFTSQKIDFLFPAGTWDFCYSSSGHEYQSLVPYEFKLFVMERGK